MSLTLYELAGARGRRFSPYCWRVRFALAHKGLAAELVPVRFTDKPLIAFSGQTLVPILREGARVIADSAAIADYLETAYPDRPSLFGGPIGRGGASVLHHWLECQVFPPLFRALVADIFDHVDPADRDYFRASREKRLGRSIESMRPEQEEHIGRFRAAIEPARAALGRQAFLCGERPAYPDYLVFSLFQWARGTSPLALLALEDTLNPWRERMLDLFDGLARTVPAYPE